MTKDEFQYVVKQTAAGIWLDPTPELIEGTREHDPTLSKLFEKIRDANTALVVDRDEVADYALRRIDPRKG